MILNGTRHVPPILYELLWPAKITESPTKPPNWLLGCGSNLSQPPLRDCAKRDHRMPCRRPLGASWCGRFCVHGRRIVIAKKHLKRRPFGASESAGMPHEFQSFRGRLATRKQCPHWSCAYIIAYMYSIQDEHRVVPFRKNIRAVGERRIRCTSHKTAVIPASETPYDWRQVLQ